MTVDFLGIFAITAVFIALALYFKSTGKVSWNLLLLSLFIAGYILSSIIKYGSFELSLTRLESVVICAVGFSIIAFHAGIGLNLSFDDDFINKIITAVLSFLLLILVVVIPIFYFIFNIDIISSFMLSLLFVPVLFIRRDNKDIEHIMKDMSLVLVGSTLILIGIYLSFDASSAPLEIILSIGKTLFLSSSLSFGIFIIVSLLGKKVKDHFLLVIFAGLLAVLMIFLFDANIILTLAIFSILFGALYIKKRNKMLLRLDDLLKYCMYVGVFLAPFMIDFTDFNIYFIIVGLLIFILVLLIKFVVVSVCFKNYHIKELVVVTLNHNLSISIILITFMMLIHAVDPSSEIKWIVVSAAAFSFISTFISNRLNEIANADC